MVQIVPPVPLPLMKSAPLNCVIEYNRNGAPCAEKLVCYTRRLDR